MWSKMDGDDTMGVLVVWGICLLIAFGILCQTVYSIVKIQNGHAP